ncbi:MAG: FMN-binding domain protein [Firmicutes bacterium]|nr:FMN-binding domain protein [Bacillota bacterium]
MMNTLYMVAQHAVKGTATYAPKLVEVQSMDKVDAVSGATVSYKQFLEAGKKALDQARK